MAATIVIGDHVFHSPGDAAKHYIDLQHRIFARKEMLTAKSLSHEDDGHTGATFQAISAIYQRYLFLTGARMPQPVGFYARRDYEPAPAGQPAPVVIRMAAYFSDNTEHVFDIGRAIMAVVHAEGTTRAAA